MDKSKKSVKKYDVDSYLDRHFAYWDNFAASPDARSEDYQTLSLQAQALTSELNASLPEADLERLSELLSLLEQMTALQRRYYFRAGYRLGAGNGRKGRRPPPDV